VHAERGVVEGVGIEDDFARLDSVSDLDGLAADGFRVGADGFSFRSGFGSGSSSGFGSSFGSSFRLGFRLGFGLSSLN
jgi:hypothetical protein